MLTEKLISSERRFILSRKTLKTTSGYFRVVYSLKLFDFIIKTEKTLLTP